MSDEHAGLLAAQAMADAYAYQDALRFLEARVAELVKRGNAMAEAIESPYWEEAAEAADYQRRAVRAWRVVVPEEKP